MSEEEIQLIINAYKNSETINIQATDQDNFFLIYGYLTWINEDLVSSGFTAKKGTGAFVLSVKGIDYEDDERWDTWPDIVRYLLSKGARFL